MSAAETSSGSKAGKRAAIALVVVVLAVGGLFIWQPAGLYLWVKAVHVVAVISWMAGMLYLPRLFIYHHGSEPGSEQSETFKVMEARLLGVIMRPAMIATWLLGLWLAWTVFGFAGGWLWAKIACVVALSATHDYFVRAAKAFAADERPRTVRHWRLMNEVPTLLMIAIVILVIVKPF